VGERILIGDEIEVTLLSVRGQSAKLRIEAPRGVRVDREEIRRRMEREAEGVGP
jgi:carbon storage regulator